MDRLRLAKLKIMSSPNNISNMATNNGIQTVHDKKLISEGVRQQLIDEVTLFRY